MCVAGDEMRPYRWAWFALGMLNFLFVVGSIPAKNGFLKEPMIL